MSDITPRQTEPDSSAPVQVAASVDQPSDEAEVARAARLLHDGGLVAFPTETVYGLGADAGNAAAVARLYKVKKRPDTHPVIALRLAERFWPGPLTLVLKRAAGVPDAVTGGQDTVGLRIPSHPMALALLRQFRQASLGNEAAAASSFNQYGSPSVSYTHLRAHET